MCLRIKAVLFFIFFKPLDEHGFLLGRVDLCGLKFVQPRGD
ncbi:hypothetical protein PCARR_a1747 [Pseudoalteromonas carrageenovora IAM 12662]|uniref:Uncharacterized protein n=1 Tax=Pseudoalteromonas carrageenovora IAM 12662 TaxID=1314868 RepID=A0ABR9ES99_PSEVC|nr:hypothetical protein [Pseudoalteromonas carrageenovora IAM 12662]